MPKSTKTQDDLDREVMQGFPNDGDPVGDEGSPPAPEPPAPEPPPAPKPHPEVSALQQRLDDTSRQLEELRRKVPPDVPKSTDPDDPLAGVDVDKDLFSNPKQFLQQFASKIEGRVTKKLESRYQADRGTQQFWDNFYAAQPDLKQDHDLVDLTLKSNLAEMSAMPVNKAMDRLAELTRERILRYAGGTRKPKARAEGAGPPTEVKPKPERAEVTSISDIIKARKVARRAAGV